MSTRRRTLSNNRRSGLPLHEPYDVHDHSPNSSFGSHFGEGGTGGGGGGTSHHGTDRQSLAHELVSALEGDAGNETMGMSLAEEFGIYEEDGKWACSCQGVGCLGDTLGVRREVTKQGHERERILA